MGMQIGLLGEKYSLALDDGSAFHSYNLMLTNLLLYLTNINSHDFFIHLDTSENVPREISIPRVTIARILGPFVSREISPLTYLSISKI